ncbi:MAG: hypothetical protein ACOYNY_08555, partial [Caldilineaceae bacterium]
MFSSTIVTVSSSRLHNGAKTRQSTKFRKLLVEVLHGPQTAGAPSIVQPAVSALRQNLQTFVDNLSATMTSLYTKGETSSGPPMMRPLHIVGQP